MTSKDIKKLLDDLEIKYTYQASQALPTLRLDEYDLDLVMIGWEDNVKGFDLHLITPFTIFQPPIERGASYGTRDMEVSNIKQFFKDLNIGKGV